MARRFRPSQPVTASIDDDLILFHTGTGRLFTSNRLGARIWRGLEQRLPIDALIQGISDDYSMELPVVRRHVAQFLADLENEILVEEAEQ